MKPIPEEVRKLAESIYVDRTQDLDSRSQDQMNAVFEDFAARGVFHSGPCMKFAILSWTAGARKKLEVLADAYDEASLGRGLPFHEIADPVREAIAAKASELELEVLKHVEDISNRCSNKVEQFALEIAKKELEAGRDHSLNRVEIYRLRIGKHTPQTSPDDLDASLAEFTRVHQVPTLCAFVMMRIAARAEDDAVFQEIKKACATRGVTAIRADEKPFHRELWGTIRTCLHGSGFGVVVLGKDDQKNTWFNLGIEMGHMVSQGKKICILKPADVAVPADIAGMIYTEFGKPGPTEMLGAALLDWLRRNELGLA